MSQTAADAAFCELTMPLGRRSSEPPIRQSAAEARTASLPLPALPGWLGRGPAEPEGHSCVAIQSRRFRRSGWITCTPRLLLLLPLLPLAPLPLPFRVRTGVRMNYAPFHFTRRDFSAKGLRREVVGHSHRGRSSPPSNPRVTPSTNHLSQSTTGPQPTGLLVVGVRSTLDASCLRARRLTCRANRSVALGEPLETPVRYATLIRITSDLRVIWVKGGGCVDD